MHDITEPPKVYIFENVLELLDYQGTFTILYILEVLVLIGKRA